MRKLALSDEILLDIDKPVRYIGNEVNSIMKDPGAVDIRFAMCFPDLYEIGMSHLGMQILYSLFNSYEDVWCERVYSPFTDLEKIMKEKGIPLFSLESQDPVKEFDFLGITLQYEMCYSNILQILELSGLEFYSKDRGNDDPILICGGPCTYNPEPYADFFDIVYIGEGETQYRALFDLYKECREEGFDKKAFLRRACKLPGLYVPSLYKVTYGLTSGSCLTPEAKNENENDTDPGSVYPMLASFEPVSDDVPKTVKRELVTELSEAFYPEKPLVPFMKVTQDRVVLEIMRGCTRGCRFCQAGMIYRPLRERSLEFLKESAVKMLENSGQDEISLSSLSSSDYSRLPELVDFLIEYAENNKLNISLPSLRVDAFSLDVMKKVQDVKKSSVTFAPEAGSQRLRNVINKGLSEEDILEGCKKAFLGGWNRIKLYFMLGLPTESEEDIKGIAEISDSIARLYYDLIPKEERKGKVSITASTSFFIPKPFTPFQWAAMGDKEEFTKKAHMVNDAMRSMLNHKSIKYNWHDTGVSVLEGALARGDRRLSGVIVKAYENGARFDAWTETFKEEYWLDAFSECNVPIDFYTRRERSLDELLPWDFIDIGVNKEFLKREWKNALEEKVTKNCREGCAGCGVMKYGSGVCTDQKGVREEKKDGVGAN
ncbi:MAG: TIGR03960 family B12-binding radical SAM protein [Lachnospiraceae bacterium]|nr:TIGR03960 family B12-binding radical SAM protein [Lachnospiraceae bacterium]